MERRFKSHDVEMEATEPKMFRASPGATRTVRNECISGKAQAEQFGSKVSEARLVQRREIHWIQDAEENLRGGSWKQ